MTNISNEKKLTPEEEVKRRKENKYMKLEKERITKEPYKMKPIGDWQIIMTSFIWVIWVSWIVYMYYKYGWRNWRITAWVILVNIVSVRSENIRKNWKISLTYKFLNKETYQYDNEYIYVDFLYEKVIYQLTKYSARLFFPLLFSIVIYVCIHRIK